MFSRKLTSVTVLTLTLPMGAAAAAPAQAARARGDRGQAGVSIPESLSATALVRSMMGFLRAAWVPKTDPPPPNHPGNTAPGQREGTGVCPNGNMRPHPGGN